MLFLHNIQKNRVILSLKKKRQKYFAITRKRSQEKIFTNPPKFYKNLLPSSDLHEISSDSNRKYLVRILLSSPYCEVEDIVYINLHKFLAHSTENGPGLRTVIWVQGCTLHCPGCFNPDTHDITVRQLISVGSLTQKILKIPDIEGVTISGGEPFLQAAALIELCQCLREVNLGIIVFSGFPYQRLIQSHEADWEQFLEVIDLLIAGPFVKAQACDFALKGSHNQTLHYLSDRYRAYRPLFEQTSNSVEIHIDEAGQILMTGFPSEGFLISPSDTIKK